MENRELVKNMLSPDPDVRDEAREELTLEMDDEIASGFLDLIKSDAPEEVIADAVIGLGPIVEEAGDEYIDDDEGFDE